MIDVVVDPADGDPPYEQIRTQIAVQVANGELPPGTKLPTVRALATTLGIAPNTVARAYRELESAGTIVGRGRKGTFVTPRSPSGAIADAQAAAEAYAGQARTLGLDPEDALGLVRAALGMQG